MDINSPELPFLSNIGFMLTYKCTIACSHCIVKAGPHRKEEMRLEHSLAWIEQARSYRDGHIKGLALTGGEDYELVFTSAEKDIGKVKRILPGAVEIGRITREKRIRYLDKKGRRRVFKKDGYDHFG